MTSSRIVCPVCMAKDTVIVQGLVSMPLIVEGQRDGFDDDTAVWDWDSAEVVYDHTYMCTKCGLETKDLFADNFLVRPVDSE